MRMGRQLLAAPPAVLLLAALSVGCPTSLPVACRCIDKALICSNLQAIPNGGPYRGLETLILTGQIEELPDEAFAAFPDATSISLSNSQVRTVSEEAFEGVPELRWLDLSENKVSDLSSLHLPRVRVLVLKGNSIDLTGDAPGPNAPLLQDLTLSACGLRNLPKETFSTTPLLESLDLSRNGLERLQSSSFEYAKKLKNLDLSRNYISALDFSGASLDALQKLDLSENKLRHLEANAFDVATPQLQVLLLDDNNLERTVDGPLFHHRNLQRLSLRSNAPLSDGLDSALVEMPKLLELDVSGCACRDIQAVLGLVPSLEVAKLSRNRLTAVAEDALSEVPFLQELHLGENDLNVFDARALRGAEHLKLLDVSDTPLSCECLEDLQELELWAADVDAELLAACKGERVCAMSFSSTYTPEASTPAQCWRPDAEPCPENWKCCPKGHCSKDRRCTGDAARPAAALAALVAAAVALLGAAGRH